MRLLAPICVLAALFGVHTAHAADASMLSEWKAVCFGTEAVPADVFSAAKARDWKELAQAPTGQMKRFAKTDLELVAGEGPAELKGLSDVRLRACIVSSKSLSADFAEPLGAVLGAVPATRDEHHAAWYFVGHGGTWVLAPELMSTWTDLEELRKRLADGPFLMIMANRDTFGSLISYMEFEKQ